MNTLLSRYDDDLFTMLSTLLSRYDDALTMNTLLSTLLYTFFLKLTGRQPRSGRAAAEEKQICRSLPGRGGRQTKGGPFTNESDVLYTTTVTRNTCLRYDDDLFIDTKAHRAPTPFGDGCR